MVEGVVEMVTDGHSNFGTASKAAFFSFVPSLHSSPPSFAFSLLVLL